MKRSKTLVSITLLITALLLGCETPEPPIIRKPTNIDSQISLASTVYFWYSQLNFIQPGDDETLRTELLGTGTSYAEFLPEFELILSHIAVKDPMENSFQLLNGKFELIGGGCHIYGTYVGRNVTPGEPSPMELLMDIQGGSGYYAGAGGHLIGWLTQNDVQPSACVMGIRGNIQRYPESNP